LNYTINYFVCPECGHEIPLPRRKSKVRERGHIKDLYCPWCGKVQKTKEIRLNRSVVNLAGEVVEYK